MLTALILICSLSSVSDTAACTEQNAVQVLRSPETFASPVACLMHGQGESDLQAKSRCRGAAGGNG